MLKIGEFSKLSRVSIRMLRHYDDIGLIKPYFIDPSNGYRYYQEEQLFIIGRITSLKEMGFSLSDIIQIINCYDCKEKINTFLLDKKSELRKEMEEYESKIRLLDSALKRLEKESLMEFDVNVKTIPERYAATVQMVIPRYEEEGLLWSKLMECKNLIPDDPCLSAAVFLDAEYKEENVEVMIWMSVKGKYYFEPNQSGVNQAKEETVLIVEILKGTHGFIDPIPFFKSRIDTMNKLRVKEIRYHTDYFVLKKSYEIS